MRKSNAGRKLIPIDKVQFEKLCAIQCRLEEIAGWFTCSIDTIERWCKREYEMNFAEVFKQKRGTGAVSLRRKQYEVALSGNVSMLIWLGKQYLGQSDKQDVAVEKTAKKLIIHMGESDLKDELDKGVDE